MSDPKRDGIDATNQDFRRYDQVDKQQTYRLAESDHGEEFDDHFRIRTCDIGSFLTGDAADRRRFSAELGAALEDIGFAILIGHGIPTELHADAHREVESLFTETPLADKLRFRAARHGSVNQGYFPLQETTDIHPDQVEGWVFCRRAFDLDPARPASVADHWPNPGSEHFFRHLCLANERLILPIMQSILTYLGCDPHLYDDRLTGTNFGLRLNYYPPISDDGDAGTSNAARLLGHEDVDLFTLLPAPAIEGLQVLNRTNMKWVRLHAPAGSIILNTGDYMQRITNDRLPSTTHRVEKPRNPELRGQRRTSCPMNVYLWESEVLEVLPGLGPPKYEPIDAETFHTRITSKYYGDDYASS